MTQAQVQVQAQAVNADQGQKPKRRRAHLVRRSKGEKIFAVFNIAFFIIFTIICVYPFYYLIINSISSNTMSAAGEINLIPQEIHWENYKAVLGLEGLSTAALVSLGRTVLGTALTVFASAFLGFMFTQPNLWRRNFWYRVFVVTMYFNAGIIPMFITMKLLGLTNTFWVYVLPAIVQPFNIILVKTYIESIPRSLQEAAEMDGAGIVRIFYKIIMPMCTPILATVAIFSAVGQWNSFQDTLMYITDSRLYSLQYLLYQYINQASSLAASVRNSTGGALNMAALASQQTPTSIRMTVSVVVVLPILFVYPFFQRYFVKGIFLGAVKG
ncbi:MAG: carbohydrate ABC transporter permease [Bifidobacteriaceae bacterium]|jgi:multiple sugar transport system permease protein/putative aldouronate transport system permease protein|nr:carbohydrate ABC transporter permease [Bifidobacteriaceae bacterium]